MDNTGNHSRPGAQHQAVLSDPDNYVGADLGGTNGQFWYRGKIERVQYDGEFTDLALKDRKTVISFVTENLNRLGAGHDSKAVGLALSCRMIRDAASDGRSIPSANSKFASLTGSIQDLEHELSATWSTTVSIMNDAEAMAASVSWYNKRLWQNLLVVTLGTSIGVSFVFGGRPFLGPYTSVASHLILEPDGEPCDFDNHRGCWKTLVGSTARLKLAEQIGLHDASGSWDSKRIAEVHSDPTWQTTVERFFEVYAERVARGIAIIASAVPVDCAVLTGGVARAGDLLLAPLRKRLRQGDLLPDSIAGCLQVECEPRATAAHGAAIVASWK